MRLIRQRAARAFSQPRHETGPKQPVFKPRAVVVHDMSRPQYYQQTMPHVVNGGLIDFRDNMHTGVPEYPTPMNSAACMYPVPGMPGQASLGAFPLQGAQMGCVSGPPSYMQINGVVYRPVEESLGAEVSSKPPLRSAEATLKEDPVKVMSESELEHAIDLRVQQRVDQFLSSRRHPKVRNEDRDYERPAEPRHADRDYERAEPRHADPGEHRTTFEEEAAKRLKGLNASMRKGSGV